MGLHVVRQQVVSFTYNETEFKNGFRVDLLVENQLLVEITSIEQVIPVHKKQVLTFCA
ncbi:MAG: GxxExxY protein [Phycisphaerae bacterium]|nr:GxxExxY protein [Gemmatimonadaceae bacterium]